MEELQDRAAARRRHQRAPRAELRGALLRLPSALVAALLVRLLRLRPLLQLLLHHGYLLAPLLPLVELRGREQLGGKLLNDVVHDAQAVGGEGGGLGAGGACGGGGQVLVQAHEAAQVLVRACAVGVHDEFAAEAAEILLKKVCGVGRRQPLGLEEEGTLRGGGAESRVVGEHHLQYRAQPWAHRFAFRNGARDQELVEGKNAARTPQ
mmetsp:Transcript_73099/g.152653  ORF Transcript_73099/g.152653 Transcript_73099/m.152653 type:complete len:208 (+) Transcript_73099:402-1025(+)